MDCLLSSWIQIEPQQKAFQQNYIVAQAHPGLSGDSWVREEAAAWN